MEKIEEIDEFFNSRVATYDKHKLDEIKGMKGRLYSRVPDRIGFSFLRNRTPS